MFGELGMVEGDDAQTRTTPKSWKYSIIGVYIYIYKDIYYGEKNMIYIYIYIGLDIIVLFLGIRSKT